MNQPEQKWHAERRAIAQRLSALAQQIRQMDEAQRYQLAKEAAEQVGRTDEAFILELLKQLQEE